MVEQAGSYFSVLGSYGDNGKENGSYYSVMASYGDNGKENGSYYSVYWDHTGRMEKKMEATIVH